MSINIIKPPASLFTMECKRCECAFTYTIYDLVKYVTLEYVKCPCCHTDIPHDARKRD